MFFFLSSFFIHPFPRHCCYLSQTTDVVIIILHTCITYSLSSIQGSNLTNTTLLNESLCSRKCCHNTQQSSDGLKIFMQSSRDALTMCTKPWYFCSLLSFKKSHLKINAKNMKTNLCIMHIACSCSFITAWQNGKKMENYEKCFYYENAIYIAHNTFPFLKGLNYFNDADV